MYFRRCYLFVPVLVHHRSPRPVCRHIGRVMRLPWRTAGPRIITRPLDLLREAAGTLCQARRCATAVLSASSASWADLAAFGKSRRDTEYLIHELVDAFLIPRGRRSDIGGPLIGTRQPGVVFFFAEPARAVDCLFQISGCRGKLMRTVDVDLVRPLAASRLSTIPRREFVFWGSRGSRPIFIDKEEPARGIFLQLRSGLWGMLAFGFARTPTSISIRFPS